MKKTNKIMNVASFATSCLVTCIVTGMFAGSAQAQTSKTSGTEDFRPYTVKFGVYAPSSGDARAQSGQFLLGVEGTYVVQHVESGGPSTVVGLGYYERNGLRILPLTLTQMEARLGSSMYNGFGIGAYNVRPSLDTGDNRNKALFGVHYLIGKNLDESRFVEARYNYANSYNSKFSINGFQLSYGVRF